MSVWHAPSLLSLFVFNPSLGNEDTESAKLLYFYPPSTSLNGQKDAVGLIEAICGFSAQLVGEGVGADCMRGEEELHAVLQCEPQYYIVAVVKHSCTRTTGKAGKQAAAGEVRVEWEEDAVDEHAVLAQLRLAYSAFRTFNGTFASCAAAESMDGLRARLDLFWRFWLPTVPFATLHLQSPLLGYQYLPVDAATYLTVQLLGNGLKANFPAVAGLALLHDARLVYTDVQGADMEALYAIAQDGRQPLHSYLALNEELSARMHEAEAATAPAAGRADGSDADIFVLPRSMYDAMAVKRYNGPPYAETPDADFLAAQQQSAERREAAGGASRRDNAKRGKRADGSATSPSTAATAPPAAASVGFLTGPYRSPLPAAALPFTSGAWATLNSPAWSTPLPLTLEDRACVDSPRLHLQPAWRGRPPDEEAGNALQRLVIYRRHAVTLLLVVECEPAGRESSNSPPLALYDALESYVHSTLKKLALLLQTAAIAPAQPAASTPPPASSTAASGGAEGGPHRFLYYNGAVLVLAGTLDVHALPAEAVRGVRDCQRALTRRPGGASAECVIRLRGGGWVCGRRAEATQRHFIALLDERLGGLQEVQREMDHLVAQLFHNVCLE